jgi:hypothetical protein
MFIGAFSYISIVAESFDGGDGATYQTRIVVWRQVATLLHRKDFIEWLKLDRLNDLVANF